MTFLPLGLPLRDTCHLIVKISIGRQAYTYPPPMSNVSTRRIQKASTHLILFPAHFQWLQSIPDVHIIVHSTKLFLVVVMSGYQNAAWCLLDDE